MNEQPQHMEIDLIDGAYDEEISLVGNLNESMKAAESQPNSLDVNSNTDTDDTHSGITSAPSALHKLGPKGSFSWALDSSQCKHTLLEVDYCREQGCSNKVHQVCQGEWECTPGGKELGPGTLRCPYHHEYFPKAIAASATKPTAPPSAKNTKQHLLSHLH
jgi:hypothetical protein